MKQISIYKRYISNGLLYFYINIEILCSQIEFIICRNVSTKKKIFQNINSITCINVSRQKGEMYLHNEINSFHIKFNKSSSIKSQLTLNIQCLRRYFKYDYCYL